MLLILLWKRTDYLLLRVGAMGIDLGLAAVSDSLPLIRIWWHSCFACFRYVGITLHPLLSLENTVSLVQSTKNAGGMLSFWSSDIEKSMLNFICLSIFVSSFVVMSIMVSRENVICCVLIEYGLSGLTLHFRMTLLRAGLVACIRPWAVESKEQRLRFWFVVTVATDAKHVCFLWSWGFSVKRRGVRKTLYRPQHQKKHTVCIISYQLLRAKTRVFSFFLSFFLLSSVCCTPKVHSWHTFGNTQKVRKGEMRNIVHEYTVI